MCSHEKVAANLPTCIDGLSRTIYHQAPQINVMYGNTLTMCWSCCSSQGGNGLESCSPVI